jgi:NAD(P)-dependent dehydrogenase (short-subunit alcohol dehydrogenase family)
MTRTALILGCSSGFGAAASRAYAHAGYDILGVHLDRRSTLQNAFDVQADVEAAGQSCRLFNLNAADEKARGSVLDAIADTDTQVQVLLHSLAFGTLLPFVAPEPGGRAIRPRQLSMTLEVMANSLVWWTGDLVRRELMGRGGRVFAMTSSGSHSCFANYSAVGAAKATLECHVRYLAMELAPRGITVNAILAGVTDTPALRKIPGSKALLDKALAANPSGRLTTPQDVAEALIDLSRPGTHWLTGNTLRIDGGEDICS